MNKLKTLTYDFTVNQLKKIVAITEMHLSIFYNTCMYFKWDDKFIKLS